MTAEYPIIVPADLSAERAVVGTCVNTRHGLARVAGLVGVDDFYSPRNARLFGVLEDLDHLIDQDERIEAAARLADVDPMYVADIVDEAPVMFDSSPWARRVADAARRRRALHVVDQARAELGAGASFDRVIELLLPLVAA